MIFKGSRYENVGVYQVGDGASLLQKAFEVFVMCHFGLQDFDSDLRFEVNMLSQVDIGEASSPDQVDHAVVAKLLACAVPHARASFERFGPFTLFDKSIVEALSEYVKEKFE